MKALIAVLLVASVAAEQKREAEPSYGHGVGFPLPHGVVSGRQYGVGYGHAAIAQHPYGGRSFVHSFSHNLHKREAEPGYSHPAYSYGYGHSYGYAPAIARHPYGGRSFVRSFNHNLHKREAEPGFVLPAYGYGHGGRIGYGYGPAVAYHPYGGLSFTRSYNHVLHKRDANPSYGHTGSVYGYSSSVSHPGYGYSYQQSHGFVPAHYALY
ncbi:shematrin-like protein 1 [Penaeus indicus]|uniref:shematrin-like protein 1 n=1 Tax=Penaeus indicus TaxID=29960 RepID=UPI00300D6258